MNVRELLAAATPRPWEARCGTLIGPGGPAPNQVWAHGHCLFSDHYAYAREVDAELIVRAVNEYEALLAAEEKLRSLVDVWRGAAVGPDSFGQALAAARAAVDRLDEVRGG